MTPRRVLIATGIYPPDVGGSAIFAQTLMEELPAHGYRPRLEVFSRLQHVPWGIRHLVFFGRVVARGRAAEVLLALDPVSSGAPTSVAALLLRRPFVLRVGGDYAWEQAVQRFKVEADLDDFRRARRGWRVRLLEAVQSFVARRAVRVIVPGEFLGRRVRDWGVAEGDISIIPNAPRVAAGAGDPGVAKQRLGLRSPVVVSVGRLLRLKGFPALLEAVDGLRVEFPTLQFVIVGSGPERDALLARIGELGLEGHVRLTGAVDRSTVIDYLRAADLFVLNSSGEGQPQALLEAMAVGTPVIATRRGGIPDLIQDGENGLLLDPDRAPQWIDALRLLLRDPARARKLGEAGRSSVEGYDPVQMVARIASVLDEVR